MVALLPLDRQFQGRTEPVNVTNDVDLFYPSTIYPWSEPVRFRIDPKLKVVLSTTGYTSPNSPPSFFIGNFESRWHFAWSEPVRQPRRLHPALNPFLFYSNVTPIPNAVLMRWLMQLSEPVRLKKGMRPWLQQTFAMPLRLLPVANVFVSIAATETNTDTALMAVSINDNVPKPYVLFAGANVTIAEIPAISGGAASIGET